MMNKPTPVIAGKIQDRVTLQSEIDRAETIMRFVCDCKIRHSEDLKLWYRLEAELMDAVKAKSLENLYAVNDRVANEVFDYLLQQERWELTNTKEST